MKKYLATMSSVLFIAFFAVTANATCKTNSIGTVYCSKFPTGGAEVNSIGTVKCGKGQCAVNSIGTVKCSKVQGGGAAVNSIGTVKCLGGCENGSESMCVRGES